MRLLLHACCGPCLIEPYEALASDHVVDVAYANPNIQPVEEYRRRRDTLLDYAGQQGITVHELSYDSDAWNRAIAGFETDPARRCRACFELRLSMAAEYAAEHGYEAIATTLTVSPYQDADAVREAGVRAATRAGLSYVDRDFRERYREATRRARERGMYRQNYCGCLPSRDEAQSAREARKAARRRARVDQTASSE